MKNRAMSPLQAEIEKIVRPIVEGQIRGFLKEHLKIVEAVDWYKPRKDKAATFTNSLSKRIVRDLACGTTAARLEAAIMELVAVRQPNLTVECCAAGKRPTLVSWLAWVRRIVARETT